MSIDVNTINDETVYLVAIKEPIKRGVIKMLPREEHQMTGKFLKTLIEENGVNVIRSAHPR